MVFELIVSQDGALRIFCCPLRARQWMRVENRLPRALASPTFSAARQSPSKLGLCAYLKKTLPFGYSVALTGRCN